MPHRSNETAANELRLLISVVSRRWQERLNAELPTETSVQPRLTAALPGLLERLAGMIAGGSVDEEQLYEPVEAEVRSPEQAAPCVEGLLREYQALHEVVLEVLEESEPLPSGVRRLIAEAFHTAERRVAREALARQAEQVRNRERQLRALVESNILGVVEANLDGRVFAANQAFLKMIGHSQDDLSAAGVDWRKLTPPEYREVDERALAQVRESGRCDLYEKEILREDGSRVTVLVGRALTNPERGDCITYVVDRTRFKELEVALERHAAELEQANDRLSQWLAMIAHELRTPLSTISNAHYILESLPLSDRAARQVSVAARQARHAARLVNDLMDLSRIARGKIELRREPVSLRRLASDAVESVRPLMDSHGHQLTTAWTSESLVVNADPLRIEQIVNNLLTNAAKYTEPGGRISVSLAREGDDAVLRVRDTGIGIEPEKLPLIFNLYEQFGLSETRSHGGLGIGLSLVRRLVELHGGTVVARSEGRGHGSEFEVRLSLVGESAAP
ncbi:MAG: ATP-binding protein [Armatimonadota bacterium]